MDDDAPVTPGSYFCLYILFLLSFIHENKTRSLWNGGNKLLLL